MYGLRKLAGSLLRGYVGFGCDLLGCFCGDVSVCCTLSSKRTIRDFVEKRLHIDKSYPGLRWKGVVSSVVDDFLAGRG